MKIDHAGLIARWEKAFSAANGKQPYGTVAYERGWYVSRSPSGIVVWRYRRAKFEAMIINLEMRA